MSGSGHVLVSSLFIIGFFWGEIGFAWLRCDSELRPKTETTHRKGALRFYASLLSFLFLMFGTYDLFLFLHPWLLQAPRHSVGLMEYVHHLPKGGTSA